MKAWETIESILIMLWNKLYEVLAGYFGVEVNPDWVLPEE